MLIEMLRSAYYRLPDDLQRALLVKRRERIWTEAGIVFVHVPKAAGTSINEALYGRFMGHVRAADIERWGSAKLKSLPSFAVTRNPWDRLVSAFRFAKRLRDKDWRGDVHVPPSVRAQIPPIDDFAIFVTEWLAHRQITELNQIFQPQSLFLCNANGDVIVDHLGQVEDIGSTYDFVSRHVGQVPPFDRANRSGEPVNYREYYTPALAKLVGDIYADDVRLLGYEFGRFASRRGSARWEATRR
jgi:hypothetical protein